MFVYAFNMIYYALQIDTEAVSCTNKDKRIQPGSNYAVVHPMHQADRPAKVPHAGTHHQLKE